MNQKLASLLTEVVQERTRQDQKWGEQNHAAQRWIAILVEEVGEVAKETLEGTQDGYRYELIHVAAVALAAIESVDRSGW